MELAGPNGDKCTSSYVGAMPQEAAFNVYWAIEVLLLVLRIENLIVGRVLVLPKSESDRLKDCANTYMHILYMCIPNQLINSDKGRARYRKHGKIL